VEHEAKNDEQLADLGANIKFLQLNDNMSAGGWILAMNEAQVEYFYDLLLTYIAEAQASAKEQQERESLALAERLSRGEDPELPEPVKTAHDTSSDPSVLSVLNPIPPNLAAKGRDQVTQPPKLVSPSELLTGNMLKQLVSIRNFLPPRYMYNSWTLVYSTDRHGISINTFYHRLQYWDCSLIFLEDTKGNVFGGFASSAWETAESYFGTGESFLFSLYPELRVYPWSGKNEYYMLAKGDHIEMGGGYVFLN
jgi:hypothetical protein